MDINRLRQGERIAAISAVVLLFVMFVFNWYTAKLSGGSFNGVNIPDQKAGANAWQSFSWIDLILFLGVIGGLGLAYVRASGTKLGFPLATIVTGVGGLGTLLVFYRILNPPGSGGISRGFGIYLGLIAVAGLTYGAYLVMQDADESFSDVSDRVSRGSGDPPSAPPPDPPTAR